MLQARTAILGVMQRHLTLDSKNGWYSQARFLFIQVGTPGVYNVSADAGVLGVEVRSIPQDNLDRLR